MANIHQYSYSLTDPSKKYIWSGDGQNIGTVPLQYLQSAQQIGTNPEEGMTSPIWQNYSIATDPSKAIIPTKATDLAGIPQYTSDKFLYDYLTQQKLNSFTIRNPDGTTSIKTLADIWNPETGTFNYIPYIPGYNTHWNPNVGTDLQVFGNPGQDSQANWERVLGTADQKALYDQLVQNAANGTYYAGARSDIDQLLPSMADTAQQDWWAANFNKRPGTTLGTLFAATTGDVAGGALVGAAGGATDAWMQADEKGTGNNIGTWGTNIGTGALAGAAAGGIGNSIYSGLGATPYGGGTAFNPGTEVATPAQPTTETPTSSPPTTPAPTAPTPTTPNPTTPSLGDIGKGAGAAAAAGETINEISNNNNSTTDNGNTIPAGWGGDIDATDNPTENWNVDNSDFNTFDWDGLINKFTDSSGKTDWGSLLSSLSSQGLDAFFKWRGLQEMKNMPDYKQPGTPTDYYNDPFVQQNLAQIKNQVNAAASAKGMGMSGKNLQDIADASYSKAILPFMQMQYGQNQFQNQFEYNKKLAEAGATAGFWNGLGQNATNVVDNWTLQNMMNQQNQQNAAQQQQNNAILQQLAGGKM